ncbi:MAG TPA: OmpA family protein [Stellaceae bacterium]|nr:OmpA family protein [Stellaceae bacterium]
MIHINVRVGVSFISSFVLSEPIAEPNEMETQMSRHAISWRHLAAVGVIALLGACAQTPPAPPPVASNPPPVAPGPNATWYSVAFDTGSYVIDANGQNVVNGVIASLQRNPASVATLIGRTDTVGSNDYNMHLSHRRADSVRDAIIYGGKLAPDRVETRWTGETRPKGSMANNTAAAENRVVDIAIH